LLFGLVSAVPISDAAQENPVIAPLTYTSQQLAIVVTELNQFRGNDPKLADQIIRHAQETLITLEACLKPLREQKGAFDLTTALQLAAPLLSLDGEVHQLATALKAKKDVIDKDRMTPIVFSLLKQTQHHTAELCDRIVQNLPVGISAATSLFASEIKTVLSGIVDIYKPESDVTIVIADPNHPFSGGFTVQPASGANGPYSPQSYPSQQGPQGQQAPYPSQLGQYLPQQGSYQPQQNPYPPRPQPQQQQKGSQQSSPWYKPNP